ncbi:hypothetical protein TNCV_3505981 [Trichonephila clavipes]|uniref:Uncharacterized protein n=1 Tax=Trichonephila clavipes TaxID=2585209 RepID=A0A8X6S923_TRICX|nr:hypothetical protein TNCV_3505981 [Trichonephila clavipes]
MDPKLRKPLDKTDYPCTKNAIGLCRYCYSTPPPMSRWIVWRLQTFNNPSAERLFYEYPNIERKKQKNIFERHRNPNPTPTTSHDASRPTVTEEPSGETSMKIPLPNTPQASRPGTPENFGPTFENCRKL